MLCFFFYYRFEHRSTPPSLFSLVFPPPPYYGNLSFVRMFSRGVNGTQYTRRSVIEIFVICYYCCTP